MEGSTRSVLIGLSFVLIWSYVPVVYEKENDMRFVYCVTTISYILNDWSAIDRQKTIDFIKNSLVSNIC